MALRLASCRARATVHVVRAHKLVAVGRDDVIETVDPGLLVRAAKLVVRDLIEHALDENDGATPSASNPFPIIVFCMFLNDADHQLEVALRALVFRRAVVGVQFWKILDQRAIGGEEADPLRA
jgi:hypothetical protein